MQTQEKGQQSKGVDKLRIFGKFLDSSLDAFIDFDLNGDGDKPMQRRKRKKIQKECSSTSMMISAAIKAVDVFSGKYKEEQSNSTSENDYIEQKEIDPEDGDVTMKHDNNLDIDSCKQSDEDDTSASMPVAIESNNDDDDSVDQEVYLPKISSADLVPAFQLGDWPRPAVEWKTRKRQWPSEETVQKVVECGCHIVSKRPLFLNLNGDPTNEDNSPESDKTNTFFRLSFSRCELLLAKSLTETQKCCWRILKAYQKAFLGTEPKVLASYHWKNVVFWVSEETDPSFWTEDNVLCDIDEANVSDEDNDDTSANMPVTTESNYDDDDSEDQKVFLPKVSSADLVPAFKFGDWPRPAAEWKTRNRQWPSEEIVQKVLECGCHIVSKRPLFSDLNGDPANEDNSPESDKTNTFFRLSFSRCELLLAKSLTESQNDRYIIGVLDHATTLTIMTSYPSRQCDLTNSNMVFLDLAIKIDSSLHPNLQVQLKEVKLMNGMFAVMDMEELIPVGSCMDGSKVNTPTDYGDVDILLVPKKYVLNEQLFDYDPNYPAFLHVSNGRVSTS
ncbi:hypothetical protein MAR_008836 [Mya arenaria]|uniref:Mab-21-like nucleotidyltransferase domain-containing protein n=1 Tax=Mya arenaria TaxID=6604 RepID=A0ABY7DX36_MYAAR|nr:hypothetical protein MAR_008836 [Mya arenaria]